MATPDVTITLSIEQAHDLLNSFISAERGREDFEYLASLEAGDYSPADVEAVRRRHQGEVATETLVFEQVATQIPDA